jgi:hypothetical protein
LRGLVGNVNASHTESVLNRGTFFPFNVQYVIKHVVWYLLSSVCFVVNVKIPEAINCKIKAVT